jgi:hypothetical protein
MNLIEALKTCKETGGKLVKNSWTTDTKDYCDYTIPVYIYWHPNEEAFVAVFELMDADSLPDTYARVPEDYMNGVIVSSFSVQDILAEDWRVFGGATFANCF